MAFDRTKPPGEATLAQTPEAAYGLEFGKTYVAPEDERPAVSLNPDQGRVLAAWADRLIPAGDGWPGAAEVGAVTYADNVASRSPLLRAMLLRAVDLVEREALGRHGEGFAGCTDEQRAALLGELEGDEDDGPLFDLILELIFEGYYRAAPVLEMVEKRTGFRVMAPVEGVEIEPFDESLLGRVKQLPRRWREVAA
ncbi:MAG: gluconate 2-dehydrogenase subunit 3 family protein [Actinobacteria bacterium]|nr:gluconate 2-dehydrogenase subunit 3 family protein [Actinomycetota bacterium]